jgi:hypothetical protein
MDSFASVFRPPSYEASKSFDMLELLMRPLSIMDQKW